MTTIVFDPVEGVIAYDSRCTSGTTICSDDMDKRHTVRGVTFIIAGEVQAFDDFIESYFDPDYVPVSGTDAAGFVVDDGVVYYAGVSPEKYFKSVEDGVWAIGSGSDHALTAMDLGCSAKEAVKMAMKRDVNTGGKVRVFKIRSAK